MIFVLYKYGRPGKVLEKHKIIFYGVEPKVGLEPTTRGLQNRCSTD